MNPQSEVRNGSGIPPQPLLPKCQHCGADPAMVLTSFASIAGAQIVVFHCGNERCRAVYSVQALQPQAQQQSRIIHP